MDPVTAEWTREYRYRRLFRCSHDAYLDEPNVVVDWMLHIDSAFRQREAEQAKQQ